MGASLANCRVCENLNCCASCDINTLVNFTVKTVLQRTFPLPFFQISLHSVSYVSEVVVSQEWRQQFKTSFHTKNVRALTYPKPKAALSNVKFASFHVPKLNSVG